jgi:dTDP-N-acetylfucosamine:lipid II N-acetylfucosaminyltransferase
MNLHIVPDNVFINRFYENLQEAGAAENNRIVVRTNHAALKYIKHNLAFARLYSRRFDNAAGDSRQYKNVYIHQFTPLLYRWVATHHISELNWMVWGADLYNLPSVRAELYGELTWRYYVNRKFSLQDFLYRAKVSMLHEPYRDKAYRKVSQLLTWMTSEYEFAREHLPSLSAKQQFFFYENEVPYHALDEIRKNSEGSQPRIRPTYILGNSSTPELNHIDAVAEIDASGVSADLVVPVSYGDAKYAAFLRRALKYKGGELRFMHKYLTFPDYLQLLNQSDGLIMNNIRPQGYGNIFMMMYLGKKIFLNPKNLSIPELNKGGLAWRPVSQIKQDEDPDWAVNRSAVTSLLSHTALLEVYRKLFS